MNSWEKNGQKFTKVFCLADKVHFLGSEDSVGQKPSKKDLEKQEKVEEKVENHEDDIDDVDDIPF